MHPISHMIEPSLNSSNTDGLFTMAESNSFLSPYKIRPKAPENKAQLFKASLA